MASETISTQNLCTLVLRCLQTHAQSPHGLTLNLLVDDVWQTFEESTFPNPFTKQPEQKSKEEKSGKEQSSSSSKRKGSGRRGPKPKKVVEVEETEAQRKQEDIACLRSKIQTVMEILCSTPLVEALSYVGEDIRGDKKYRLRCTVPLPLQSPVDFKTIVQEINRESQRGRERLERIKRIKSEIRKISEKSRNRSSVKHDKLQAAIRSIVGDSDSILQGEPAYRDLESALKKARRSK